MRNFTLLKTKAAWVLILIFSLFFVVVQKLDYNEKVFKTATVELELKTNKQFLIHLNVENYWCALLVKHQKKQKFSEFTKNENLNNQGNSFSLKNNTNLKTVNYV